MCKIFSFFLIMAFGFSQNNFNDFGEKNGIWHGYHDNGSIKYRGEFLNGKEIGAFHYYDLSGYNVITLNYIDTGVTSLATLFHLNGKVKCKGKYINKKKEGLWSYYNENEILTSNENYINGALDGSVTFYNENQSGEIVLTEKYMYAAGLKHGIVEIFYPSGFLNMRGNYKNGKLDGVVEYYYNNSNLKIESKGSYSEGLKDSIWIFFGESGDTLKSVMFQSGSMLID